MSSSTNLEDTFDDVMRQNDMLLKNFNEDS